MKFLKAATKAPAAFFVTVTLLFGQFAFAADAAVDVNVDNFVRAETASQFDSLLDTYVGGETASQFDSLLDTYVGGKVNTWAHLRMPSPIDNQTVIRMNRDTLYSATIVDISKGATLTIQDTGDRYISIMVVNEDHYINKVYHKAGTYDLSMDAFHTPYVMVSARTLVDSSDPALWYTLLM